MADLTNILKSPVQSTKSIDQKRSHNVYTFKVWRLSNKFQIKLILERIFGVKVEKVRISRKKPFLKNRKVKTSLEKKAFVKLREGYKIVEIERMSQIMKDFATREEDIDEDNIDIDKIEKISKEDPEMDEKITIDQFEDNEDSTEDA